MFDIKLYPVLSSVADLLDKHTPNVFINKYSQNQYHSFGDDIQGVVSPEQTEKDLNKLIGKFKACFMKRMINIDLRLLKKLIDEKDVQVKKIQTVNNNEFPFIDWYNNQVMDIVNRYCNHVHDQMDWVFGKHYDDSKRERIKVEKTFSKWHEQFSKLPIKTIKTKKEGKVTSPQSFLRVNGLENQIEDYESNIPNMVIAWGEKEMKTECAIFMLVLFHKNYFTPKKHITAIKFAKERYNGIDITNTLRKLNLKDNANKLKIKMDEMIRLINNTPYGLIK